MKSQNPMFPREFELILSAEGSEVAHHIMRPGAYVIGSDPECDIVLESEDISCRHSLLSVNNSGCEIEDLGSSSGTFVDGQRITSLTNLGCEQQVQIGSVVFQIRLCIASPARAKTQRSYAAFISYRHSDNREVGRQWANWLHHAIETYEVPADLMGTINEKGEEIPSRIFPVFRDEEELPADADLSGPIVRALENSKHLVVLCSPGAVASKFVADEILRFKAMGKSDRVIAAIISGEPNVTTDAGKQAAGWTEHHECFPEPLRYEVESDGTISGRPAEPIAADFRQEDASEGWTSPEAFRDELKRYNLPLSIINQKVDAYAKRMALMKLKVIAGILGVPLGMLTKRDQAFQLAQAKQRARTLRRWLIAVAALSMIAAVSAVWAWRKQKDEAAARGRETSARLLAQERLVEAARADRGVAVERLIQNLPIDALPHLARSLHYDASLTLAAEMAVGVLNRRNWQFPSEIFLGHEDGVWRVSYSPDGKRIATASFDNSARVWDATSGKLIARLQGHKGSVTSVEFSADGSRIVTASHDGKAMVWDSMDGRLLLTFSGHAPDLNIETANFSPDGRRVVSASLDATARVWESASGRLIATLQGHKGPLHKAEFSPDGQQIVTASMDKSARVWDAESGEVVAVLQGHQAGVISARFSPDGRLVVTASGDPGGVASGGDIAMIWEVSSGKALFAYRHQNAVFDAEFSPDGRRIVTASADGLAAVWEVSTGKSLFGLRGHRKAVYAAHYSADGQRIVTASGDGTAMVWDARSGTLLTTLHGHEKGVTDARFSADGQHIVTASFDATARLWQTGSLGMLASFEGHTGGVWRAEFSGDGRRIATASDDKTARVWDVESGDVLSILKGHEDKVLSATFSTDRRRVVTASLDHTARIWDVNSGLLLTTLRGHDNGVTHAQFNPDGKWVITASSDRRAKIWDAASGKLLRTLDGHQLGIGSAMFSPDGTQVVTASADGTSSVWNADSGRLLTTFSRPLGSAHWSQFRSDGRRIVTGFDYKMAEVWNPDSGKLDFELVGHDGFVGAAAFSPAGDRIVTASGDSTARIWEGNSGGEAAAILQHDVPPTCAQFSPDGRRVVTTQGLGYSRALIWELLGETIPPPQWFGEFLNLISVRRLNNNGQFTSIPAAQWLLLRDEVTKCIAGDRSRYGEIARWVLAPQQQRPVHLGSETTVAEAVDRVIKPDALEVEIRRAYHLMPWHSLVQLALARFEEDPVSAEFLRKYALDRIAPDDPQLKLRAGALLQRNLKP